MGDQFRAKCKSCPTLQEVERERDALKAFAKGCIQEMWDGGIDGCDVQELAVKYGLIVPAVATDADAAHIDFVYAGDEIFRYAGWLNGTPVISQPDKSPDNERTDPHCGGCANFESRTGGGYCHKLRACRHFNNLCEKFEKWEPDKQPDNPAPKTCGDCTLHQKSLPFDFCKMKIGSYFRRDASEKACRSLSLRAANPSEKEAI